LEKEPYEMFVDLWPDAPDVQIGPGVSLPHEALVEFGFRSAKAQSCGTVVRDPPALPLLEQLRQLREEGPVRFRNDGGDLDRWQFFVFDRLRRLCRLLLST
jgi:hypothetical protein